MSNSGFSTQVRFRTEAADDNVIEYRKAAPKKERILPEYSTHVAGINIVLLNAAVCSHNNSEPAIPDFVGLMSALALAIAFSSERLSGLEIRFLRKSLSLKQAEAARRVGVSAESFSKWENEKQDIEVSREKLLRMAVASSDFIRSNCPSSGRNPYDIFEMHFERDRSECPLYVFERILFDEGEADAKKEIWDEAGDKAA